VPPRDKNVNAELAAHARSVKNVVRFMPAIWTVDRPCHPLPDDKLINKQEVEDVVGVGYTTIYTWMVDRKFPRPVDAAEHSLWLRSEVLQFISMLARRRLKGDPPPPAAAENDPPPPAAARRARRAARDGPPLRVTKRRAPRRTRSSERAPMTTE
jgi:predicted DNA-binding transcriptional regulator AlpA